MQNAGADRPLIRKLLSHIRVLVDHNGYRYVHETHILVSPVHDRFAPLTGTYWKVQILCNATFFVRC